MERCTRLQILSRRFVMYIKVDSRPFPEPLTKTALTPDGPLHVVSRRLTGSKDFRAAEHVLAFELDRRRRAPTPRSTAKVHAPRQSRRRERG
jgi:hypothetical protein